MLENDMVFKDQHTIDTFHREIKKTCVFVYCKNSQILQQKLYFLVELCENAMTLKYVIP